MTKRTRRAAILKLIAEIDQNIAESRALAHSPELSRAERRSVRGWLAFYKSAVRQAVRLLKRVG
jgi:hypothetical protein